MGERRFVFWSGTYAFAVALVLIMVATWLGVVGTAVTWWFALALGAPLAASVYLARRARVSVALEGDRLTVRPGIGPATTLMLRAADRSFGEGPYREGEAEATNRSELAVVDHAEVDGPVIAERTPLTRGIGSALRLFRSVFRHSPMLGGGSMPEAMGKVSVVTAAGEARHFIVPAQGDKNEASLAALQRALNRTDDGEA